MTDLSCVSVEKLFQRYDQAYNAWRFAATQAACDKAADQINALADELDRRLDDGGDGDEEEMYFKALAGLDE